MRLIDADALMKLVQKTHCTGCNNYNKVKCRACDIGDMLDYLDDAPTVDGWHYPSKEEYPTEKELVLMKIPGCYALGWFRDNKWFFDMKHDQFTKLDVLRWQYITPPKEER